MVELDKAEKARLPDPIVKPTKQRAIFVKKATIGEVFARSEITVFSGASTQPFGGAERDVSFSQLASGCSSHLSLERLATG
jgi:hypothetical protein